jgi:hypothetical protein
MEQRFFKAIWLGRDTATGETLLGGNKVVTVGARTVRRMLGARQVRQTDV